MIFKYPEKAREINRLDQRAVQIVKLIEAMYFWKWMEEIVITEIWRNNPVSPHYWWRAVDIAISEKGKEEGTEKIRKAVNDLFPYGSDGYETIPPLDHAGAPHIHVQVKPKGER